MEQCTTDPCVFRLIREGKLVLILVLHGQCMTDPCVFRLIREGKLVLILVVHVDDMAVAGTKVEVNKLLVTLNKDFERMTSESCLSLRDVPSPKTLRRV